MDRPLMPKATAVWLVENTSLTFDQIADFCGLHPLEVKGIADGEVATGVRGLDPVGAGMLTREELQKGEAEPEVQAAAGQVGGQRRQAAQAQGAALHALEQAPGPAGRDRLAPAQPSRADRDADLQAARAPPRPRCRRCASGPTGRARRSARAIRCSWACARSWSSTTRCCAPRSTGQAPAAGHRPAAGPAPAWAAAGIRLRRRAGGLSLVVGVAVAPVALRQQAAVALDQAGDAAQIVGRGTGQACPG